MPTRVKRTRVNGKHHIRKQCCGAEAAALVYPEPPLLYHKIWMPASARLNSANNILRTPLPVSQQSKLYSIG